MLEVKYFQVFSPTDRNFMPDIGKLVRWMLGSYLFVCVTPIFLVGALVSFFVTENRDGGGRVLKVH